MAASLNVVMIEQGSRLPILARNRSEMPADGAKADTWAEASRCLQMPLAAMHLSEFGYTPASALVAHASAANVGHGVENA